MKIEIRIEVEVPDGASHYYDDLLDDPVFYKCKVIAGFDHWFYYSDAKGVWHLSGHRAPFGIKKLEKTNIIQQGNYDERKIETIYASSTF